MVKGILFKKVAISDVIFPIVLTAICVFLAIANWVPGTYLSGWDTLHPEFNFPLNFQRLIFGVFRDNQGLGAIAAHAHMSDLPRVVLIYLFSFFLPDQILRYAFIVSCWLIGSLGIYFFCKEVLLKNSSNFIKEACSFLGGLFYLLNLGTLQHFYVPFEMFTVQFAFLPWLFLLAAKYINTKRKSILFYFAFVNLLASPMAYAPVLWYAYFASLILFLLPLIRKHFKSILLIIFTTLLINSFWLLPNIYFLLSGAAQNIPEAKINQLFSEEAFSYNKSYGNLQNILIFKNFLFDWTAYQPNGKFEYLLYNWREHLEQPFVLLVGYFLSFIAILGLIYSIFKKNRLGIALIIPSAFALIFLINENPPFEQLFIFLRNQNSIFKEALRFPFTKFSIILIFAFACYFALFQEFIAKFWKILKTPVLIWLQVTLFTGLIIFYMFPAFKGDYISKLMQVRIPKEYFEIFDWFNNQPNDGRVANLPIHSFWGWTYYNFGFQGAGFLSFGIKQPLLDRDFDRWNPSNETYYREMSNAVYSKNLNLLENTLDKYQIKYLFLDENVINPSLGNDKGVLFTNEIKSLLSRSKRVSLKKNIDSLYVYEYDLNYPTKGYFFNPTTKLTSTGEPLFVNNQNVVNNSLLSIKNNQLVINPSIKSEKNIPISSFLISEEKIYSKVDYSVTQDRQVFKFNLFVPKNNSNKINPEIIISPELSTSKIGFLNINGQETFFIPTGNRNFVSLGDVLLSTQVSSSLSYFSSETQELKIPLAGKLELCDQSFSNQEYTLSKIGANFFSISSKNATACYKINLPNLGNDIQTRSPVFLLNLSFNFHATPRENLGGVCLFDNKTKRCIKKLTFKNGNTVNFPFLADNTGLKDLSLIFYNFNTPENPISEYENIQLTQSHLIGRGELTAQEISQSTNNKSLDLSRNQEIFIDEPVNEIRINLLENGNRTNLCSNILPQFSQKTINSLDELIEYNSKAGSICDSFSLPNLSHDLGYILYIDNKNLSGLPLRVCVNNNTSKRCDIYTSLGENIDNSTYLLIPPSGDGGIGYDINLENISIGNTPTINQLREVKIFPVPYRWLSQFFSDQSDIALPSDLSIDSLNAINPTFYNLSISNSSTSFGILGFNQAFDNGWVSTFGPHKLLNSWANGWIINGNIKNIKGYIFFWPQILEFIGFLLSILTLGYLFFKKKS